MRSAARLRAGLFAFALGWCVLATARPAAAYPQWQFSSGAVRCNQCHFAPAGGGLINGYGRDQAGDDLSTFSGNGAFAHGAVELPAWLALGAEARGAFLRHDSQDAKGTTQAAFPMQADVYVRAAIGDRWSIYASGGYEGQVRQTTGEIANGATADPTAAFVSREHYVMWRPKAIGAYVRAGRFYAPFGLRLAEHIVYVRRDLGFNLMQETYNVSGGYVKDDWELHATAFVPDYLREIGTTSEGEKGVAVYVERRFAQMLGIAIQGRGAVADRGWMRTTGGLVGKLWIEPIKTMVMTELDLVDIKGDGFSHRQQFYALGGLSFFPFKGLMLTAIGERKQDDLSVKNTDTNAVGGFLSWFPYPHFELAIMGRLQQPAGLPDSTKTLLLQLHYYL